MTKEQFVELIKSYEEQEERIDILDKVGITIWESPLIEFGYKMFEKYLISVFGQEHTDTIYWWLLEKRQHPDFKMYQDEKEIPMETIDDLWNYISKPIND